MNQESTTPDLEGKLRQALEAANRRDFDAALAIWAPDGVWELSPVGMGVFEPGRLVGHQAIQRYWEEWTGPYEESVAASEGFRDLGHGVTLTVAVQRGRPHGSSSFVESRSAVVMTWREGRIVRATNYTDIDEARAAAERLAEERG